MDVLNETLEQASPPPAPPRQNGTAPARRPRRAPVLQPWLRAQAINVTRHAAALRPFQLDEFGTGDVAPSDGHIQAVNTLLVKLRHELLRRTALVRAAVEAAEQSPTTVNLHRVVRTKEQAHVLVQAVERVWDFYFELFGQRQSRFAEWLLGCDRIARDCYQAAYRGIDSARSVPAPPPFAYMRTGFSPATYRRSIPLRRLGHQLNPFPLIQLPYHRLVNPWTLGAVLHEVSHNLQNDLGLARIIPRAIAQRLLQAGHPPSVAAVWARWNRELFADVCGVLLGGPMFLPSLMDVVGRGPATVLSYNPRGPHPTPYLRTFITIELLGRMGFPDEAAQYRRAWTRVYPNPQAGTLPGTLLTNFPEVIALVVDTVCYQPYATLGNKSLARSLRFLPKDQQMIEEGAGRLAAGNDPGIIPARFLIGAARVAFDRRLARPGVITTNFYKELARR